LSVWALLRSSGDLKRKASGAIGRGEGSVPSTAWGRGVEPAGDVVAGENRSDCSRDDRAKGSALAQNVIENPTNGRSKFHRVTKQKNDVEQSESESKAKRESESEAKTRRQSRKQSDRGWTRLDEAQGRTKSGAARKSEEGLAFYRYDGRKIDEKKVVSSRALASFLVAFLLRSLRLMFSERA
jgi:chromatin remodeling complex protein RSC6